MIAIGPDLDRMEDGIFLTEASQAGLPIGQWPKTVVLLEHKMRGVDGRICKEATVLTCQKVLMRDGEVTEVRYTDGQQVRLVILND